MARRMMWGIACGALVATGGALLYVYLGHFLDDFRFDKDETSLTGRVTRVESGRFSTHVEYTFKINKGAEYEQSFSYPGDLLDNYLGNSIRVQYVPSDPAMNRPAVLEDERNIRLSYVATAPGLILLGLALFFLKVLAAKAPKSAAGEAPAAEPPVPEDAASAADSSPDPEPEDT